MPLSGPLYERVASAPPVPAGLPMVVVLTGFTDAGGAVSQMIELFREDLSPSPVVSFSADVLLDYRARRPVITFDADHQPSTSDNRLKNSTDNTSARLSCCPPRTLSVMS